MASNTGKGYRQGAVRDRSQVRNPKANTYIKRNDTTGRFMDGRSGSAPFKGVRKEK